VSSLRDLDWAVIMSFINNATLYWKYLWLKFSAKQGRGRQAASLAGRSMAQIMNSFHPPVQPTLSITPHFLSR
jgi:hypothetical protein